MSGIRLDRAATGENTLIVPGLAANPMRVPCLHGDYGRWGLVNRAPQICGLVFMHDVNTLQKFNEAKL